MRNALHNGDGVASSNGEPDTEGAHDAPNVPRGLTSEEFHGVAVQGHPQLMHLAQRILRSREDAEDAVQNALMRAWSFRSTFHGRSRPSTWLYRIAVNAAVMHRRSEMRHLRRSESLDVFLERGDRALLAAGCIAVDPEREFEERELRSHLRVLIEALPEPLRSSTWLHAIDGLSCDEVANITGVTVGATKSRIHRARRMLAESLRAHVNGNHRAGNGQGGTTMVTGATAQTNAHGSGGRGAEKRFASVAAPTAQGGAMPRTRRVHDEELGAASSLAEYAVPAPDVVLSNIEEQLPDGCHDVAAILEALAEMPSIVAGPFQELYGLDGTGVAKSVEEVAAHWKMPGPDDVVVYDQLRWEDLYGEHNIPRSMTAETLAAMVARINWSGAASSKKRDLGADVDVSELDQEFLGRRIRGLTVREVITETPLPHDMGDLRNVLIARASITNPELALPLCIWDFHYGLDDGSCAFRPGVKIVERFPKIARDKVSSYLERAWKALHAAGLAVSQKRMQELCAVVRVWDPGTGSSSRMRRAARPWATGTPMPPSGGTNRKGGSDTMPPRGVRRADTKARSSGEREPDGRDNGPAAVLREALESSRLLPSKFSVVGAVAKYLDCATTQQAGTIIRLIGAHDGSFACRAYGDLAQEDAVTESGIRQRVSNGFNAMHGAGMSKDYTPADLLREVRELHEILRADDGKSGAGAEGCNGRAERGDPVPPSGNRARRTPAGNSAPGQRVSTEPTGPSRSDGAGDSMTLTIGATRIQVDMLDEAGQEVAVSKEPGVVTIRVLSK